jgi:hypothetical protein
MLRPEVLRMKAQIDQARKAKKSLVSIRTQDLSELITLALGDPESCRVLVKTFKSALLRELSGHLARWEREYDNPKNRLDMDSMTYDHGLVLDALDSLFKTARAVDKLKRRRK